MNHYLVELKIVIGEFEKGAFRIAHAASESEACNIALLGQAHMNIGSGAEYGDGGLYDDHGAMHYKVKSCRKITPEHLPLLQHYIQGNPMCSEDKAALIASLAPKPEHWNPESHWDDHPEYSVDDWRYEVENNDTRQSYVDWVNSQIEQAMDLADDSPSPGM